MSDHNLPKKRSGLRLVVSLLLLAVIVFILSRSIQWSLLLESFHKIRPYPVVLLAVIHLINVLLLAPVIWCIILHYQNCHPRFITALEVWAGAACLRAFMPMKSGEIVSANYLRIHENLPLSKGVGSLVFLHFLNFYSLWFYFAMGLWWVHPEYWIPAAVLLVLLIGIMIFLPSLGRLARVGRRFHPKLGEVLMNLAGAFTDIPARPRIGIFAVVLCFQALDIFIFSLGFAAVGMTVPIGDLIFRVPLVYILANLPFTPMGIGTREATMMYVFSSFGPAESILAIGVVLSFCLEILPVIVSLAALPRTVSLGLFKR